MFHKHRGMYYINHFYSVETLEISQQMTHHRILEDWNPHLFPLTCTHTISCKVSSEKQGKMCVRVCMCMCVFKNLRCYIDTCTLKNVRGLNKINSFIISHFQLHITKKKHGSTTHRAYKHSMNKYIQTSCDMLVVTKMLITQVSGSSKLVVLQFF